MANGLEQNCHAVYFVYEALQEQYNNMYLQMQLGNKSDFFIKALQSLHTRIITNVSEFAAAAVAHYSHSGLKTMTDKLEKLQKEVSKMETEIMQYIAQEGQTVTKKIGSEKNAALFKPDRLNHDSSIADWRQWQGSFATYCGKMNMKEENTQDQRSFLCSCLDSQLQKLVTNTRHTTIYNDGEEKGWLHCLQEYFDSTHPMHMRLLKLMEIKPLPGQLSSAFFQEFVSLVEDANAAKCDVKVLIATIMVSKCPNDNLRRELIRKPVEVEEALRTSREFDAAEKGGTPSKNTANAVSQIKTKCFRCGKMYHKPEDCFTLKSKCPTCLNFGHSMAKCNKKNEKGNNVKGQQSRFSKQSKHNANMVEDTNPSILSTPTVLL